MHRLRVFRHALGALLLLLWRWSGTAQDQIYGSPGSRLLAAMDEQELPWLPGLTTMLRARIWLFGRVERLMPEYWGE